MPSYVFNTSMFTSAPDHNEIATAVSNLCEKEIGFDGLSNVHIPWAQAKGLAMADPYYAYYNSEGKIKESRLYQHMKEFIDRVQNAKRRDAKRGKHVQAIFRYITATTSFNTFYSRLKWILKRLTETGERVNVVYYTDLMGLS